MIDCNVSHCGCNFLYIVICIHTYIILTSNGCCNTTLDKKSRIIVYVIADGRWACDYTIIVGALTPIYRSYQIWTLNKINKFHQQNYPASRLRVTSSAATIYDCRFLCSLQIHNFCHDHNQVISDEGGNNVICVQNASLISWKYTKAKREKLDSSFSILSKSPFAHGASSAISWPPNCIPIGK